MFILLVRYKCKLGCRSAFYDAIRKNKIDEKSRSEEGNLRYEYSFGVSDDELILNEIWRDAEAIEIHKNSEHFAQLGNLKGEYVLDTEIMKFSADQI